MGKYIILPGFKLTPSPPTHTQTGVKSSLRTEVSNSYEMFIKKLNRYKVFIWKE